MLAKDETSATRQEKLLSCDNEIEHLKLGIATLRRMVFGTPTEKIRREIEQLELKLEELETQQAERVTASTPGQRRSEGQAGILPPCRNICQAKMRALVIGRTANRQHESAISA